MPLTDGGLAQQQRFLCNGAAGREAEGEGEGGDARTTEHRRRGGKKRCGAKLGTVGLCTAREENAFATAPRLRWRTADVQRQFSEGTSVSKPPPLPCRHARAHRHRKRFVTDAAIVREPAPTLNSIAAVVVEVGITE